MPSLSNIIGQASRGADLYFVFRFLRLLTMKYESTNAYKLGIIDKKGKALKKSTDLETIQEKSAYTMLHRLVFKIRGLIEKVPLVGKSILLNYAAALFLLKEQNNTRVWTDDVYMKTQLLEFLETDWEADAKFLKEEVDNMNKKSFKSFLTENKTIEVEIEEKKTATDYELYHDTFSAAMQHAYAHAKSKGFVVDPEEIDDKVATGPKKPSNGKTNRYILGTDKKKNLHVQVANLDNKRYELNMYMEEFDLKTGKVYEKTQVEALEKEGAAEFMAAASAAKREGKKKFKFGGKEYPVTIKVDIPLANEEIANSVGGGGIAGLDIGLTAKKKKEDTDKAKVLRKKMVGEEVQRTTFAGKDVFIVDSETYYKCRLGKKQYGRYETYVGNGNVGQTIREYGLRYPRRPIILQNGDNGPMLYLKYGRS